MKTSLILLLTSLFAISTHAQNLTGKIVDGQSRPLEFANIVLRLAKDSSFTEGTVSDPGKRYPRLPASNFQHRL